jgi:hypothetical protein
VTWLQPQVSFQFLLCYNFMLVRKLRLPPSRSLALFCSQITSLLKNFNSFSIYIFYPWEQAGNSVCPQGLHEMVTYFTIASHLGHH